MGCCGPVGKPAPGPLQVAIKPISQTAPADEPCCGSQTVPGSPYDRAGYKISPFVKDFVETPVGPVPRVGTGLDRSDMLGTIRTRLNIGRDNYRVAPGLYCVNNPDPDSLVLVTANYKLSFDALRKELDDIDAWILVLDTHAVNVWCAAGKGTLSTGELTSRIALVRLESLVRHRKLILPQLAATGVSAHKVKKDSGFNVVWGPVRACDIRKFLKSGMKAEEDMRRVTFTMIERLVLIPVEISQVIKPAFGLLVGMFVLAAIGAGVFSFESAWIKGLQVALALVAGVVAGAVVVPLLLPWIPGRSFSLKGMMIGLAGGGLVVFVFRGAVSGLDILALVLGAAAISSYLAMNFTGATPFTSPSGVEKEMRRAIPVQAVAMLVAVLTWVGSAFI